MPKRKREEVVQKFRDGETCIPIYTNVLSQGIDVAGIKLVINYDFPMGTMLYSSNRTDWTSWTNAESDYLLC